VALLHDVAEGHPSPGAKARESDVTGRGFTEDSFEELFLAHYGRIVAVLRRLLGDWGRAEDLANEAFLKLYRRPLPQRSDGNVPGWLYRTAVNLGIDALRSSARRKQYEQAAAFTKAYGYQGEDAFDQALRAERQQRVRAVLAQLKPAYVWYARIPSGSHLTEMLALICSAYGTWKTREASSAGRKYPSA
jgi:RNA polymerase sigma factor (sigma-70 family)